MSETRPCPDCGHPNPIGAASCDACNFPLQSTPAETGHPAATGPAAKAQGEPLEVPRRPLRRPARRAAPLAGQTVSLWLFFGAVAAAILIYTAIDANRQRNSARPPVEGSSADQQKQAEAAQAVLARDSTDVDAHVALANVLYDTGNWNEAIVHYRAALRRDSTRVPSIVDLGVCYYNLGDTPDAERLFLLALSKDPHQPVALFNLGIVNERRERYDEALRYYHRALESGPGEDARNAIIAAVERMQQKTGKQAGPLPGGAGAAGGP